MRGLAINPKALRLVHKPERFQGLSVLKNINLSKPVKKNFIRQAFLDVNFVYKHDGLTKLAKKEGIDLASLKTGEFCLFLNSTRDRIYLFGAYNTIIYTRAPRGMKISRQFIEDLPNLLFGTGRMNYDKLLGDFLTKYFQPRRLRRLKAVDRISSGDMAKKAPEGAGG